MALASHPAVGRTQRGREGLHKRPLWQKQLQIPQRRRLLRAREAASAESAPGPWPETRTLSQEGSHWDRREPGECLPGGRGAGRGRLLSGSGALGDSPECTDQPSPPHTWETVPSSPCASVPGSGGVLPPHPPHSVLAPRISLPPRSGPPGLAASVVQHYHFIIL